MKASTKQIGLDSEIVRVNSFMHVLSCAHRRLKLFSSLVSPMSRRTHSASPPPRSPKRAKIEHLTLDSFKNGVVLAPMVRSGARMWYSQIMLYMLLIAVNQFRLVYSL